MQQRQRAENTPPLIGDRISMVVMDVLCMAFPVSTIIAGLAIVRNTNFYLRDYLLLPPVQPHDTLTEFAQEILTFSWVHPAVAGPLAVLIFLIVFTLLATLRIYGNERRLGSK